MGPIIYYPQPGLLHSPNAWTGDETHSGLETFSGGIRINGSPLTVGQFNGVIYVDGVTYPTIQSAINALPVGGGTVVLPPATYSVATNLTIPATVELDFLKGAVLNIASGVTVTYLGDLEAGRYQIFSGSGTVTFNQNAYGFAFYPEWWGAVADNTTESSAALNACIAAAEGIGFGRVELALGLYRTTSTVVVSKGSLSIVGPQSYGSGICYSGTGIAMRCYNPIGGFNFIYNVNLEHFAVLQNAADGHTGTRGLSLEAVSQGYINDVLVESSNSSGGTAFIDGCYFCGVESMQITYLESANCTNGVHLDSVSGLANASLNFSYLGMWWTQVALLINNALNVAITGGWWEWFGNAVVVDNDGTSGIADIENVTIDNVRMINGPTSPYQNYIPIVMRASNSSAAISVRDFKLRDCQCGLNSAAAGSLPAQPISITLSTASVTLVDQPISFENCFIEGNNLRGFE